MNHDEIGQVLQKILGDELQENVSMREHTTMRVGGVADFFWQAGRLEDIIKTLHTVFLHRIPYLVLGSGSNVIFADAGFPGLVIHNTTANISFIPEKSQVIADAGCIYARLIAEAASRGMGGLEWWFGLPGTIGGAVHNNAETWGHDMSEVVRQVTMLFPPQDDGPEAVRSVPVEWMQYHYRTSRLKDWRDRPKPIILTVTLQLQQQKKDEIMRRMKEYKQGRFDLNQPKGVASAGSYFINPGGRPTHAEGQTRRNEDSAGWLLDQVGAKKMSVGNAAVAPEHANFLINRGDAAASDVRQLADQLKTKVRQQFNIALAEEVQYIGTWSHD